MPAGETAGYDSRGNRKVVVEVAGVALVLVVDERQQLVVTIWRPRKAR